jgi:SAM-dependent methyltransferase
MRAVCADAGLSRRLADFHAFLLEELPAPPARVLEIGCGRGELALALARDGFALTAIDPNAPEGPIFRQAALEDFDDGEPFDAAVASVSLHHVDDLTAAVEKIAGLLRPGGLLLLAEFAVERFAGATASWYHRQRQALAALGIGEAPDPDFDTWLAQWRREHAEIHPFAELRAALDARFAELSFAWTPYLFDYRLLDELEPVERRLIEDGAVAATGVRYAGRIVGDSGA